MGTPKLLIPFSGIPLITRVVSTLVEAGVRPVIVVCPPAAALEGPALTAAAAAAGALIATPGNRPESMRHSIEFGIGEMLRCSGPPAALLLMPADSPLLSLGLVRRLVAAALAAPGRIVLPTHRGRRGHPVILPWSVARQIPDLPRDVGVNALVAEHASGIEAIEMDDASAMIDLDTPQDLEMVRGMMVGTRSRTVWLFAGAREKAGADAIEVVTEEHSTVADLLHGLAVQYPALAGIASHMRVTVDGEYSDDTLVIRPGATLALFPPLSDG